MNLITKTKYIKLSLLLLFLISYGVSYSQSFEGVWQGVLTQENATKSLSSSYAYWLNIEQVGSKITGKSRIEIANTESFGIVNMEGSAKDFQINIRGTAVDDENIKELGVNWCLIMAGLSLNPKDSSLKGRWRGTPACGQGELVLYKSNLPFNEVKSQSNNYLTMEELDNEISNTEFIRDKKIVIENIEFETNDYKLTDTAKEILNEVYSILNKNETLKIKILGHTDNVGKPAYNLQLSVKRARSVSDYLIEKGISTERCTFEGFGESRPLADNASDEGKAKNRRIEIEIY